MGRGNQFLAGIFLLIGLFLFIASIWILGNERQIFARQEEYYIQFKDIKGLAEGAPVRLGGITVGRVSAVGFSKNLTDTEVHVTLLINEDYLERIREDAVASIETQGLLGDRFISVSSGQAKQLMPHSHLRSQEPQDLAEVLNKAGQVVENTVEISQKLNDFVGEVRTETLSHITEGTKSLASITKEIEQGGGLVHRLIYSKKDGDSIASSIAETGKSIQKISHEIEHGNGILHGLVYGAAGEDASKASVELVKNISFAANQVGEVAKALREGSGLLHDLLYQSDGNAQTKTSLTQLLQTLKDAAKNIKTASDALAHGSGTLGALLVDPSLYDNLLEITNQAKRSFLLRQAIQSTLGH